MSTTCRPFGSGATPSSRRDVVPGDRVRRHLPASLRLLRRVLRRRLRRATHLGRPAVVYAKRRGRHFSPTIASSRSLIATSRGGAQPQQLSDLPGRLGRVRPERRRRSNPWPGAGLGALLLSNLVFVPHGGPGAEVRLWLAVGAVGAALGPALHSAGLVGFPEAREARRSALEHLAPALDLRPRSPLAPCSRARWAGSTGGFDSPPSSGPSAGHSPSGPGSAWVRRKCQPEQDL